MYKFSILALAIAVAVFAAILALLRYPTEESAYVVSIWSGLAIVIGACLAIGTGQPIRSFWIGFVVASIAARYIDDPNRQHFRSIPTLSSNVSIWIDDYLLKDLRADPGATLYYLSPDEHRVRHETRDGNGRVRGVGSMRLTTAKSQGIDIAALPVAPDTNSFRKIVKQLLMLAIGVAGGGIAYQSRRRLIGTTRIRGGR